VSRQTHPVYPLLLPRPGRILVLLFRRLHSVDNTQASLCSHQLPQIPSRACSGVEIDANNGQNPSIQLDPLHALLRIWGYRWLQRLSWVLSTLCRRRKSKTKSRTRAKTKGSTGLCVCLDTSHSSTTNPTQIHPCQLYFCDQRRHGGNYYRRYVN